MMNVNQYDVDTDISNFTKDIQRFKNNNHLNLINRPTHKIDLRAPDFLSKPSQAMSRGNLFLRKYSLKSKSPYNVNMTPSRSRQGNSKSRQGGILLSEYLLEPAKFMTSPMMQRPGNTP
jgi:hypothetical protein